MNCVRADQAATEGDQWGDRKAPKLLGSALHSESLSALEDEDGRWNNVRQRPTAGKSHSYAKRIESSMPVA